MIYTMTKNIWIKNTRYSDNNRVVDKYTKTISNTNYYTLIVKFFDDYDDRVECIFTNNEIVGYKYHIFTHYDNKSPIINILNTHVNILSYQEAVNKYDLNNKNIIINTIEDIYD